MRAIDSGAEFLFGRTRARVLTALLSNPEQRFYLRQLSREVGVSSGTVLRDLEALTRERWVKRQHEGRQLYYSANAGHPAFADMRGLLMHTSGIATSVASSLASLAAKINFAFLYGSAARGDLKADSDIDLAVIGKAQMEEVLAAMESQERALGRPINPVVYTLPEVRAKIRDGNHFIQALLGGGKRMLLGEEDELRRLGEL